MKYNREELATAFQKVQDKAHWKNPIKSTCTKDELEVVAEAIIYFTATEASFQPIGIDLFKVTAPGYWAGPAN